MSSLSAIPSGVISLVPMAVSACFLSVYRDNIISSAGSLWCRAGFGASLSVYTIGGNIAFSAIHSVGEVITIIRGDSALGIDRPGMLTLRGRVVLGGAVNVFIIAQTAMMFFLSKACVGVLPGLGAVVSRFCVATGVVFAARSIYLLSTQGQPLIYGGRLDPDA